MKKQNEKLEIVSQGPIETIEINFDDGGYIKGRADSDVGRGDRSKSCEFHPDDTISGKWETEIAPRRCQIMEDGTKIDTSLKVSSSAQEILSNQIAYTKESINILKMRLEDLENQAINQIKEGNEVKGYIIKPVYSRVKWMLKTDDVLKLGLHYGVKLDKPTKVELLTPLQAIKAGVPKETVKEYAKSEFKGHKLVSSDDKSTSEDEINFDDL